MRRSLITAAGFTCVVALAVTGCSSGSGGTSDATPTATGSPAATGSTGSTDSTGSTGSTDSTGKSASRGTAYAPYVSATEAADNDSTGSPTTYNLAFVLSDGSGCTPKWNGTQTVTDSAVASRISRLKQDGAGVRVSFGGASGKELAQTCGSAAELAAAYGAALDAAGADQADFDIEGDALADSASVALRSAAIALLQRERADLTVSFTLPVMPSGLDSDGLALLESANKHDVQVSTVNLMTMNYGTSFTGDMGDYALASAEAAHAQLKKVFGLTDAGAWRGMALTSMIGVNDVSDETFTLADAAQVRSFAEKKGIAWVSMWSTFRDRQCADDTSAQDGAATDCSGVSQRTGAFATAFAG
ncbi:chitinase [Streptomyces sp. NPDC004752]